jgi:hypothetical protein
MFVSARAEHVLDAELPLVRERGWLPLLSEDLVGSPELVPGTSTSANLIHHAYHLIRFEQATGLSLSDLGSTVEIGGGYGSMCRLLYRLSLGRIEATLFDLPEFSALQRYFLSMVGVPATITDDHRQLPATGPSLRLLVAMWSLSEMPLDQRKAVLASAGRFDCYLIAYQHQYGEVDNAAYFTAFAESLPDVAWVLHDEIAHIPNCFYLCGVRR